MRAFVVINSNTPTFSSAKTTMIEAACKKAWVQTGSGFSDDFCGDDVGGVMIQKSWGAELMRERTDLQFCYVNVDERFTSPARRFEEKLGEELRRELENVTSGSVNITLCPTEPEQWFADPTWAVRVKEGGLGPQIG